MSNGCGAGFRRQKTGKEGDSDRRGWRNTREMSSHGWRKQSVCDWGSRAGEVADTGILLKEWASMLTPVV